MSCSIMFYLVQPWSNVFIRVHRCSILVVFHVRTLQYFKLVFSCAIKSGCKFPKFHLSMHYFLFMLEYGVPALTYSGWWEKAHRFLVKMPYLQTGRNLHNLENLIMLRVALADRVRQTKHFLEKAQKHGKMFNMKCTLPSGEMGTMLTLVTDGPREPVQDQPGYREDGFDETGYLSTADE